MKNVLVLGAIFVLIGQFGCTKPKEGAVYQPPVETSYSREPDDPDTALTEQLRQGSVQMAAASDTIESALLTAKKVAKSLKGESQQVSQDIVDLLDDAGASVADASSDAPAIEEVKKDFAKYDDDRKVRIESGNDAYKSLESALGTLEGLEVEVEGLDTLRENISLAMEDLTDAVEALGGKVESQTEPDINDPNVKK